MGDVRTCKLGHKKAGIVFDIFEELSGTFKQTIIAVARDNELSGCLRPHIEMAGGRIVNLSRSVC
jgi:ABC-type lipoprotein export system ATPase subunit